MKRQLKQMLDMLGYRVENIRNRPRQLQDPAAMRVLEFDDIICRRMMEVGPSLRFLQLGAFDGVTRDPLRKYIVKHGWRGVLVEPQAAAAAKLRDLYHGNDSICIVEAAIDRAAHTRTLFTVSSGGGPSWTEGLASFDRSTVTKHEDLAPGLVDVVKEEMVECVSFDTVLDKLPTETLDLLQIDAEGFDAYLLSLFPFSRTKPAIIHWEIKHASKRERDACFEQLVRLGYCLAPSGDEDMMAVLS